MKRSKKVCRKSLFKKKNGDYTAFGFRAQDLFTNKIRETLELIRQELRRQGASKQDITAFITYELMYAILIPE